MTAALLALSITLAAQPTVRAGRDGGPPLQKATPESVGLSPERLERLSRAITAEVEAGRLPGAVVAIARRGSLAYVETFGLRDARTRDAMPLDAIFRIYAMTKPFVAVAAMILMEEGKLQLTDPVSLWFPEFREMKVSVRKGSSGWEVVPAERPITVQDLLRQTSGLTYGNRTENQPVRDAYVAARLLEWRTLSPAEEVAALDAAPLAWQPGARFEDGLSADLLGRVVEAVSGMRLRDFLETRVFRPLGMSDTAFVVPRGKVGRIAEPLPGLPDAPFDARTEPGNDAGGGGAVSTALDYLRFAQMLLDEGRLGGTRLLSRTTVELMTSDHLGWRTIAASPSADLLGVEGYGFGLGFLVRNDPGIAAVPGSVGEFMWGGDWGTFFWVDPKERLVAVFMTQATGPQRVAYRRLWKQLVQQAILD